MTAVQADNVNRECKKSPDRKKARKPPNINKLFRVVGVRNVEKFHFIQFF